jgi:hypothetical protein
MKKWSVVVALALASVALTADRADAWHAEGTVLCDANGNGIADTGDLPLAGISVRIVGPGGVDVTVTTDEAGRYFAQLSEDGGTVTVTVGNAPAAIIGPSQVSGTIGTGEIWWMVEANFLVNGSGCTGDGGLKCWLTGGGTKFSPLIGMQVAERGPAHNFGGNVNPSCSAEPGEGGQWNHVAHSSKLHFQGTSIQVVQCGNVPGIEPGSESPVTPFNFIEFEGTGWVKGIAGNKTNLDLVTFFARAEDRNEPGSNGAKDGVDIDRYFLHVKDGGGNTVLLVDADNNASTADPVTITGGNLQLHISSCTN